MKKNPIKKSSIFAKTFRFLLFLFLLLVVLIHLSIFFIYRSFYIRNMTDRMDTHMGVLTELLPTLDPKEISDVLTSYAKNNGINISLKLPEDTLIFQGNPFFIDYFFEDDSTLDVKNADNTDSIVIRRGAVLLSDGHEAALQITGNLYSLQESRGIALSLLPYSLFLSLVFSLLASYFYSRKMTHPIRQMSKTVNEMTKLQEKLSIHLQTGDELEGLAEDINELYGELLLTIENYKAQNEEIGRMEKERLHFFRGASHELKTPLAKLSVLTENMRYNVGKYKDHSTYLAQSQEIIGELSDMIGELLEGVKGVTLPDSGKCSVREVMNKVLEQYRIIARSMGLMIEESLEGDFELAVPEAEFQKVLSNLISNALKYRKEDGRVSVHLTDEFLEIYNEADRLTDTQMEKAWKGDYLLPKDSVLQSSGLGLFIVKSTLERYKISYDMTYEKTGYVFRIRGGNHFIYGCEKNKKI